MCKKMFLMLRAALTSRFQCVRQTDLQTLTDQKFWCLSNHPSHKEQTEEVRNSSTFTTLQCLESSRRNSFTGPGACPRDVDENLSSPNATTVLSPITICYSLAQNIKGLLFISIATNTSNIHNKNQELYQGKTECKQGKSHIHRH